jgi:hypothetical protein
VALGLLKKGSAPWSYLVSNKSGSHNSYMLKCKKDGGEIFDFINLTRLTQGSRWTDSKILLP